MKICFKCNKNLSLSEFYTHTAMKDGHLNKCKSCAKKDATAHRNANIEKYQAYDRARGNRLGYAYTKAYRLKFPNKSRAHDQVAWAIKTKAILTKQCVTCGSWDKLHAHHTDYLKPLEITWLCASCHSQWHRDHGEALNP